MGKRSKEKSFSRHITRLLLCLVGISLAVGFAGLYGVISRLMTRDFISEAESRKHQVSLVLQNRHREIEHELSKFARDNAVRVSLMLAMRQQIEESVEKNYPFRNGVFFMAREKSDPQIVPALPEPYERFQTILNETSDLETEYPSIIWEGNFVGIYAIAVKYQDKIVGDAFAIHDLSRDNKFRIHGGFSRTSSLLAVENAMGKDLIDASTRPVPEGVFDDRFQNSESANYPMEDDTIFLPLEGNRHFVLVESAESLQKSKIALIWKFAGIGALILTLTVGLSFAIASMISMPVRNLVYQAMEIAQAPSDRFLNENAIQYAEFKKLASAFNQVVGSLNEAREALAQEARKELDLQEKRYRTLVETSPAGLFAVDENLNILFANRTLEQISGCSRESICEMGLNDLIHPRDLQKMFRKDDEEGEGKRLFQHGRYEVRWLREGGDLVWTDLMITPVMEDGKRLYQVYVTDISERKKSQEQRDLLAAAVEQTAESISIADADKLVRYINPAFEKMSGFSREEAIGKRQDLTWRNQCDDASLKEIDSVLETGGVWKGRLTNARKDGTLYESKTVISPVRNADGNITNFVTVKRDITNESRLEKQLIQAQKMQAIGTLAGGIAHDFNNILSAIMGYTEMCLLQAPEDTKIPTRLERVLHACSRAKELVKQILTFSRQTNQEKNRIQIHLIVKEALKLLRATLPSTIEIRQQVASDSGFIWGDPTQIHQVLMNLCTNAAYAMREKGGTLAIQVEDVELSLEETRKYLDLEPGRYVRLTVGDTGAGMDRQTLARIFEPFFTTKKQGEGAGLGLSVVHGIVKGHGGVIRAYSELGQGSTFQVLLPRVSSDSVAEEKPLAPLPGGSERILVVDDEEYIVDMAEEMLINLGYKVTAKTNSLEALKLFDSDPDQFDLVITDQTMPHMTGDDLSEHMLNIRPDIPIILCTGFSEFMTPEKAASSGIKGFIMKPFITREMAVAIREALNKH